MVSFFISKKQRFVAYSPIIQCLFFILWGSVRRATVVFGMRRLWLWWTMSLQEKVEIQLFANYTTKKLYLFLHLMLRVSWKSDGEWLHESVMRVSGFVWGMWGGWQGRNHFCPHAVDICNKNKKPEKKMWTWTLILY